VLMMMRYPQELVDPSEYKLPQGKAADYRVTARELAMATQLVESMATRWQPDDYHDEFRARLSEIIRKRIKQKGKTTTVLDEGDEPREDAATNVVDFVALLQKSLGNKGGKAAATGKAAAKKASKTTKTTKSAKPRKTG
jgi:DNA end-binding protein Ku